MENMEGSSPVDRGDARLQLDSLAADRTANGARAAAPKWLIMLHGVSVAAFALSFGLGSGQAIGFSVSAILFVSLGMIRPWVTRNSAEPWSSKRAVVPGVIQFISCIAIIAVGAVAYKNFNVEWALWPAAALAFVATVALGLRMERDLARDIAEGP